MAVLDVFQILFTSDASGVKKGADEAEKATEELTDKVKAADVAAEKLGGSFVDALTSAQGTLAALVSVSGIAAAVISEAANTDELGRFTDALGLNIEEVSAWSGLIVGAGGSAEDFRGSISTLQGSLTELSLTGTGPAAEVFAKLGISAVDSGGKMKSAFDLLPEIADSFDRLTDAEAFSFGQSLGLDQATILTLQKGRGEIKRLLEIQRTLGVTTEKDVEVARDFQDSMTVLGTAFSSVSRNVGTAVLPAFTYMLDLITDITLFLAKHKELVIGFFIGAAIAVTAIYVPAMITAAATTLAAAAPFIAIAAVIAGVGAAFALIYEDIQAFLEGSPSLLGKIVDFFTGMADSIRETLGELAEFVTGILDSISQFFGGGMEATVETLANTGQNAIQQIQHTPVASTGAIAATAGAINRQTSVSVDQVNVDARGGDSKEIAAGVSGALQEQLQQTVSNYDDGVDF